MKEAKAQNADVLVFMIENGKITTMDAYEKLHCSRLSARIYDLKQMGWEITGIMRSKKEDGRVIRWKEYSLKN